MEKEQREKIFKLFEHFERLKSTPRTGFGYFGLKNAESVAEHSYMVSFITLILANLLKEQGEDIDVEKAISMAILHEAGEVLIGDLHKKARDYIGNDVVEKAEEDAAGDLFSLLPDQLKKKILDTYLEFNERSTKEALLVSSIDKFELLFYVYLLEKRGQGNLEDFFEHKGNMDMIKNAFVRSFMEDLLNLRKDEQ